MSNKNGATVKRRESERQTFERQLVEERARTALERTMREAAETGLAPYVYALQLLAEWLKAHRTARAGEIVHAMKALQIWDVSLALDPGEQALVSRWWPQLPAKPARWWTRWLWRA